MLITFCNIIIAVPNDKEAVPFLTGEPTPEVVWYKGKKKLKVKKSEPRLSVVTDNDVTVLSITDVTTDDAGQYQVKITNDSGTATESVDVAVHESPQENAVEEIYEVEETKPVMQKPKENAEKLVEEAAEETAVMKAPVFEILPTPANVDIGGTIVLQCKVSGK